jgi:predicted permease
MPNMTRVSPWLERPIRAALRGSARVLPEARDEVADVAWHACADAYRRGGVAAFTLAACGEIADILSIRWRQRCGLGPRVSAAASRPPRSRFTIMMLITDFRRAARRLRSNPGTLALSVAMLALAIGVTTTMFTVLDALMLHPVPFRDASRLTTVVVAKDGRFMSTVPAPVLRAWQDSGIFAAIGGAFQSPVTFEGRDGVVTRGGARVTPGLLETLGVRPLLGRLFVDGEGRAGADDRIVLSEEIWESLFARDPQIVGRRIRVSGVPTEVVGIVAATIRFPYSNSLTWQPIDFGAPPPALARSRPTAYARFQAAVPEAAALARADGVLHTMPGVDPGEHAMFRPLAAGMVDAYSTRAVTALSVGVGLVFLVLCANAMNLMLTRFAARERDFGVCSALGASRTRLLREAVAETIMVGLAAAGAGLGLAVILVRLATGYLPAALLTRTLTPVAISWRAIVATSIVAAIAAAIAGLTPAWMATRIDATDSLRGVGRGGGDRRSHRQLSRALLVGEVALAAALLAGAGQLVRTFVNLTRADRGLNADGVITGWISLPRYAFTERAGRLAFAAALEERLARLPGVQQVSLSGGVPPGGGMLYFSPMRSDLPHAPEKNAVVHGYNVGPQFFDLFGIRLLAGRTFSVPAPDDEVVIGEQLAKLLWPSGEAVGHTFTMEGHPSPYRVIGVAREIRSPSLDPLLDEPEMYHPLVIERDGKTEASALGSGSVFAALRCGASCPPLETISRSIREVSARAEIVRLGPMELDYLKDLARPRAAAALGAVFALVALLASAGGLFGVLNAAVARRRREFGIRVALGITPSRLTGLVVRQAFALSAMGLALGIFGAWLLSRGLASLTYGVSPADPVMWAAVFGSLALTTVLAAWRPGAQAARVDPAELLRTE